MNPCRSILVFLSLSLAATLAHPTAAQVPSAPPADANLRSQGSAGTVDPIRVVELNPGDWTDTVPTPDHEWEEAEPDVLAGSASARSVVSDPAVEGLASGLRAKALPAILQSWAGLSPNQGGVPPDPTLAVGVTHVVMAVNDDFAIFTKAGALLQQRDFNEFFNKGQDIFYDPKCSFDRNAARFLCVVLRRNLNTQGSWISLMASIDGDPTHGWWTYQLDATVDGQAPNGFFADYPYLGYDQNAIYVGVNMRGWGQGLPYQYAKLRILRTSQIYNGQAAGWWDLTHFESGPPGGTCFGNSRKDFTLAPAQHHGSSPVAFVLSAKGCGGDFLTLRRIAQPLNWVAGPIVSAEIVPVGAYSSPPTARQPLLDGVSHPLSVSSTFLLDKAVYRNGFLYASHTLGKVWPGDPARRAALKIYSLQVSSSSTSIEREGLFGKAGWDYYYPSVQPNLDRDLVIAFNRSSEQLFGWPSLRYTVWPRGGALAASDGVKSGSGTYTNGRWGDYVAAQADPSDLQSVWVTGEYSLGDTNWGTWVAKIKVP